jgi:hypothetical protein
MKKLLIYFATLLGILVGFAFAFSPDKDIKTKLETLSGTYADAAPYAYGQAWGTRVFTFDKGKWTLLFTLALDPEMKVQVFQFRTFGTFDVKDRSTVVADTYNAVFFEDKKLLTLKTDDENLINAFGFAPCGLVRDVEADVSKKGCSGWKSVDECPADHDLLSLDSEGRLYFGNRPQDNDMCTPEKRPTSLTPPVIKVK